MPAPMIQAKRAAGPATFAAFQDPNSQPDPMIELSPTMRSENVPSRRRMSPTGADPDGGDAFAMDHSIFIARFRGGRRVCLARFGRGSTHPGTRPKTFEGDLRFHPGRIGHSGFFDGAGL
ncbi:hypothetical protein GCM10029978_024730 [Actinoallomurus acanthiterrae]